MIEISIRWRSKNEEEDRKKLFDGLGESLDGVPLNLEFKEGDDYKRVREISSTEKLFKGIEKSAIWAAKLKLKLQKSKNKDADTHELQDLLNELPSNDDKEKFRNLICCYFCEQYLDEFISVTQALGFKDLGGFEYLGRRDADYSIALDLDESYRLHARIYNIKNNSYVLIHHEPKATEDIKLHIKGYFDRIIYAILKKEEDKKAGLVPPDDDKLDIDSGSDGKEKVELSNYEKGSDMFLKMLSEKVPNFYKKINTKITENDLKIWREYMGKIDHLSPEQLIVENIYESSRLIPPFSQIRETFKKVFHYFQFETEPAWETNVLANDKYFIAYTNFENKPFKILVITDDFTNELLRPMGLLRAKYEPNYVMIISPDISLFGPTENDIPPENKNIPPFNKAQVHELIKFLEDSKVSIASTSFIIELFKMNLKTPLRVSHFALMLKKYGLLSCAELSKIVDKEKSLENFQKDVFKVLDIIKTAPKDEWINIKQIEKIMTNRGIDLNKTELENVLLLMENKLLELILSKKQKHKEFRINSGLEESILLERQEKLRKMLKEYLLS